MAFMNDKLHSNSLEQIKYDLDELIGKIRIIDNDLSEDELNKRVQNLTKLLHLKSSVHRLDQGERRLLNNKIIALASLALSIISLLISSI